VKVREKGVLPPSEVFFYTESEFAKSALYYIFAVGTYFCNKNYFIEKENFFGYLIAYIHSGKMRIKYNNRQYIAKENDVIFLNLFNAHSYGADENLHFEYFHFDGNATTKYFDLLYNKNGCIFPILGGNVTSKYVRQIFQMSKERNLNEHYVSMAIHRIMYELMESTSEKTSDQLNRDAISYIENHFNEDIPLEKIANELNISVCYLVRMFKKHTGSSPHQYLLDYRIHHAKDLLKNSNNSIEDIAFSSGFNSSAHFVTTFKKRTNLTPKQFRDMKF
jgi:AraC family transcriptional regulator